MLHYHVHEGMGGGYMPDVSDVFDNLRDARRHVAWALREMRDQFTFIPFTSKPFYLYALTGAHTDRTTGAHMATLRNRTLDHDLGRYIEINPCADDCELDDDG